MGVKIEKSVFVVQAVHKKLDSARTGKYPLR